MALTVNTGLLGNATIIDTPPRMDVYDDVLCVPFGINGAAPGIYDRGRLLITASGEYRGLPAPGVHLLYGEWATPLDPEKFDFVDTDPDLVFAGRFHNHFGHFLISSISRFWWATDRITGAATRPSPKLLHLHGEGISGFFRHPFVDGPMAAMKIAPSDFISFDRPVRIRRLTIPAHSFQENNCAHRAFAEMCHALAGALSATQPTSTRPVYISKSRLLTGVSTIVNEYEFAQELERFGFEVVYPETMSLADQINLFRGRLVAGVIGSALMTSVFAPRSRLAILTPDDEIFSNQVLIDGVNRNASIYCNGSSAFAREVTPGRAFHIEMTMQNPTAIAKDFLQAIETALI